ncbi:VOC family protein [Amycolatopsis alkalitolerans]|uniref:VOC family protein n=1 Tax=Amycolatopsis alkalitolerans TaxID=2547244 RepID=A0A5C4LW20_9PSEU|nr:VOC family protein [Amycolatopsis alkalitolerans]TNC23582.1 VOC family protein [Amycolatopsis alkalitolerans]
MDTTLAGFHHVKLPVSDVRRSLEWYERVLGFRIQLEFVEDGVLEGVALTDPGETVSLALRHDPAHVGGFTGFDPIALCVPTADALRAWQRRLDDLGEAHGGIAQGHVGSVLMGLRDPDGIEIRFYCPGGAA